ncbi:MAG: lasso peptide biosynthesis B2 protein [Polyangiaceae bacterium]
MRSIDSFRRLSPGERAFFVVAWGLVAPVSGLLRAGGLERATRWIRRLPIGVVRGGADVDVERADALVRRAFRWSGVRAALGRPAPEGRGDCLPQALVQLAVHRLAGRDAVLFVGVRKDASTDFEAHAWVEERGGARRDLRHAVIHEVSAL